MEKQFKTCDGNAAATNIAYAFSEVAAIFPITPSSPMGELADAWSVAKRKNLFGQIVKVQEMQSEGGAAGAIHGSLTAGALTTTFTASQGILLMLPNMFKIAGEMLPTVFHVAARSLAYQALSIYADHSDVMATRGTGFALLSSSNVQEAQDMAAIAHMATLKSSIPFMHFFDGFRTSHEIQKIKLIPEEILKEFIDKEKIKQFKARGIKPENPYSKVGAENPDVYFQGRETVNKYYDATPEIVKQCMKTFEEKVGRKYELFSYIGHPEAEKIVIAMGSSTQTIEETVNYLVAKGEKIGAIRIHLYRPFSAKDFLNKIPKSVKKIAVLDRTKESGSLGEPLYLDVLTALSQENRPEIKVIGGRYGLSSKEFTPSMVKSVFTHLDNKCTHNFTVGITDDVTHLSLPMTEHINTVGEDVTQCKFWGYGSDGTVSANKNSIKIIGEKTDKQVQAYFAYDSKKSGGVTVSHLRFGDKPITSTYQVHEADFIALHKPSYIGQYDILEGIKENGTFLINSHLPKEEIFASFTKDMQETIKKNNVKVYVINAFKIAREAGLKNKISTVMQIAFFKVANIIPVEQAISFVKEHVAEQFKRKGQEIIDQNFKAIDETLKHIEEVPIIETEKSAPEIDKFKDNNDKFVQEVIKPIERKHGDTIPVSAMTLDGSIPIGTTKLEKRGVAVEVPEWDADECIQCGLCSFACPHAAIRTKQIKKESLVKAPKTFNTLLSNTKNEEELQFKVQVYTEDCLGCNVCVNVCPKKGKALKMVPIEQSREKGENENQKFFDELPDNVTTGTNPLTVKGTQFNKPYFEFSGACAGCGETPTIKLITQMFGDRMVIANATGCSSIYGGMFPTIPYATNKDGKGPAWANSLFEDNAEYGYGMKLAIDQHRNRLKELSKEVLKTGTTHELRTAIENWLKDPDNTTNEGKKLINEILNNLDEAVKTSYGESKPILEEINELKDYFLDKSLWIIGGDGWAYDIGFGGLDHVIAQGKNINILVLDNEQYANTGGQSSKATPRGATAKFAMGGKGTPKKNLGMMAMTYGNVYVASVDSGANPSQLIKAIKEAEEYEGTSIIIAYSTCIAHGINMGESNEEGKLAMQSGYWPLYRYDPRRELEGKDPLQLDSKEPTVKFEDYILNETRYKALQLQDKDAAAKLFALGEKDAKDRRETLKHFSNKPKN